MTIFDKRAVMSYEPNNCKGCGVYLPPSQRFHFNDGIYCKGCSRQMLERLDKEVDEAVAEAAKAEGAELRETTPIGVSEPTTRCDGVNIPLELQKKLLHATFYDTTLWLQNMLEDDDFMVDLEKMAQARLEKAHPKWGSTMYTWDHTRRFRAIMEELADVFGYASSGEH